MSYPSIPYSIQTDKLIGIPVLELFTRFDLGHCLGSLRQILCCRGKPLFSRTPFQIARVRICLHDSIHADLFPVPVHLARGFQDPFPASTSCIPNPVLAVRYILLQQLSFTYTVEPERIAPR